MKKHAVVDKTAETQGDKTIYIETSYGTIIPKYEKAEVRFYV